MSTPIKTLPTGPCPVCSGTGRVPAGDYKYKAIISGYDAATDTQSCRNCGGQTMYGVASGQVPLRPDGTPCKHEYEGRNAGRCYTIYTCKHCGDKYDIDSSD